MRFTGRRHTWSAPSAPCRCPATSTDHARYSIVDTDDTSCLHSTGPTVTPHPHTHECIQGQIGITAQKVKESHMCYHLENGARVVVHEATMQVRHNTTQHTSYATWARSRSWITSAAHARSLSEASNATRSGCSSCSKSSATHKAAVSASLWTSVPSASTARKQT
jgi:hypothetical protein